MAKYIEIIGGRQGDIRLFEKMFTEYIRWVLMKQSCPGMPFNRITETEKSSQ